MKTSAMTELLFDPTFTDGAMELPQWLGLMEQLRKLA